MLPLLFANIHGLYDSKVVVSLGRKFTNRHKFAIEVELVVDFEESDGCVEKGKVVYCYRAYAVEGAM